MVIDSRSQKPQLLMIRDIIKERRGVTKERLNVTLVNNLVILSEFVGQTRKENQKKHIWLKETLMMNLCY